MKSKTNKMVMMGLMIAIAMVLSRFPIYGTIGFDALPAFFAAVAIGPLFGGIIGIISHMMIAATTGFSLTLPLHIVVALLMFISCYAYGMTRKTLNRYGAMVIGIVVNAPLSLIIIAKVATMIGAPFAGMPMFLALIIPLTIGATINVVGADIIYTIIKKRTRWLP